MTKNTTRRKKRKNLKLRRTIRKTVAALIMIMAVIVAAIPVEQLGTMQAQTRAADVSMQNLYDAYATAMANDPEIENELVEDGGVSDATDYSLDDSNKKYTTLRVTDNGSKTMIDWEFKTSERLQSNDGLNSVIVDYNGLTYFGDSVVIPNELYTEYFVITNEQAEAVRSKIKDEEYKVVFGNELSQLYQCTLNGNAYTINKLATTFDEDLDLVEETFTSGNREFTIGKTDTFTAENIFNEFVNTKWTAHLAEIAKYNKNADDLITRIKNKTDDTADAELEKEVQALQAYYDSCKEFKRTYAELDSLPFEQFCMINRLSFRVANKYTVSLEGFELQVVSSTVDGYADAKYIPQWVLKGHSTNPEEDLKEYDENRGLTKGERSQFLDTRGYIALASLTVSGIGNGAFQNCETFSTVTFPDSNEFSFIGNDAFHGCTNLKSINLTNIKTVGNRAFKGCKNLSSVIFSGTEATSETQVLGAEAFYQTNLTNVVFPITIKTIGRGCFATSNLANFTIQKDTVADVVIWPFAFYNCAKLNNVDETFFPKEFGHNITIGMGAFAVSSDGNSPMGTFTFPYVMTKIIAEDTKDEFSLDVQEVKDVLGVTNMTSEEYYDYILAGRSNLNKVVFPYRLGTGNEKTKIPDNTLRGCKNLGCAVFGELCLSGTNMNTYYDVLPPNDGNDASKYDTDGDEEALFSDITNTNFYVEGPGFSHPTNLTTSSQPRIITTKAQTAVSNSVPYIFLVDDDPREERIEMSYGDDHECLAILEVVSDTTDPKEVKLVEYIYNGDGDQRIKDLVIKSKIGNYRLTELGEGCFSDVKDHVYELIIEDGSVTTIEANAFNGSKTLQRVTLGNSVKTIGEGAFGGCTKLENVYFSSPKPVNSISDSSSADEWASVMTIGEGAFTTNSDFLTFHGDIHSGYAPYELAMSGNSFGSSSSGRTICYKTDAPQNLTVLFDHHYGLSTLIDYPHYEEIDMMNAEFKEQVAQRKNVDNEDYSITDNFEGYNSWKADIPYQVTSPEEEEAAIIAATYNIELPDGIQSIDAKDYIKYTKNAPNIDYLYYTYEEDEKTGEVERKKYFNNRELSSGTDIKELYSNDNSGSGSDITTAGLFSGYYIEVGKGIVPGVDGEKIFNGKNIHKEEQTSGNDQLLEISLNTVEQLPSYAFESCENLNSVGLGSKLATFGRVPFKGCESLTNVNTTGNPYFTCEDGIIYHLPDAAASNDLGSGYVIEECLMTRGTAVGYKAINSTTDARIKDVSGIKPEAFSYCPDIQTIDLSDTKVTVIPEACFRGASLLKEVVLPESVSRIDSKAFSETTAKVTIYSTTCQIESDAFDNGNGIIRGYKYADGSNTKYSTAYQYAQNHKIQFEEITAEYVLTFLDFDGSLIETQQVEAGKDGVEPNWTPSRAGYAFKEWSWEQTTDKGVSIVTGDKTYRNVTENRIILATYMVGSGIVSDGNDYTLTITDGKNIAGETKITLKGGTAVSIVADTKNNAAFQYWSESTNKYAELFEDIHSNVTTFVMPNADVTIIANFMDGVSGSGSNTGSGSGSGSTDSETKYKLTVNYGSGTGEYKAGEVVSISAYAPESSSKVFSKWTSTNTGVGFANPASATTTITMPASAVTVTANYKTRTADEEDDEELEALNRRKGTTSTTATVTTGTNNATVTTTTGTVTNTSSVGDNITINKDGISNTGVASTQVEGAADNFVVKVSDSAEAVTAAEEALKNKYGSLDGILYFPMDISLFDVTGKNKITDTTGLDVTVTMPIPDELIQYGGNVRAAAIENGQLQDLNVRFTTIDGIACMSFVPPHFSPYVIYVDTNNLVAGQMLDSTPKTGDPIHPKWFLAIGMACLSVIMFTTGDKKKKIKMA